MRNFLCTSGLINWYILKSILEKWMTTKLYFIQLPGLNTNQLQPGSDPLRSQLGVVQWVVWVLRRVRRQEAGDLAGSQGSGKLNSQKRKLSCFYDHNLISIIIMNLAWKLRRKQRNFIQTSFGRLISTVIRSDMIEMPQFYIKCKTLFW